MTPRAQRGFTLLELMVVVVLIGIILTFVVRSVGDGGRAERIQREAQRIASLVELVGEEAVLRSAIIGLLFSEQGYEFLHFDAGEWLPEEKDGLLKRRTIDSAVELRLVVEGYGVELRPAPGAREWEGENSPKPQVLFLPSGERTPFELSLRYLDDESGYELNVPPMGAPLQRRLEAQL